MPLFFDPLYLLFIAPAVVLGLWAQARVRSTFSQAERVRTPLSGAEAARRILDASGLYQVSIEPVRGFLSDHYDPRGKVIAIESASVRGAHHGRRGGGGA